MSASCHADLLHTSYFISFHVRAPIWRPSTLLLRIDSLGETNWWRIKQPAAESSPLVSHNATAPICVSFASSWEGADFKLKTVSKMAEGWGCDYDPWQSSSPHPHPPHSSVCYSQWLWKSAIVGLNGRQRQDAAIVGVEVLCVAPRSENRQQWLRVRRLTECVCVWTVGSAVTSLHTVVQKFCDYKLNNQAGRSSKEWGMEERRISNGCDEISNEYQKSLLINSH